MPIATPSQYAAMLDAATAGGYALAAVNVTPSETLNGAMRGFAAGGADGIIQVTTGAAEFLSGGAVADMALSARALAEYAHVLGERYPVLIALHTDHAPPDRFDAFVRPLIDTDAQYAFTRAVADHLFANYDGVLRVDGDVGRKAAYDPRSRGRKAEATLARRVAEASELFGSAGRSLLS